ncbi:GNAT family N-acetyltransferase [Micromonospora narathiwatensis]|uniref:Ribosomal protein S18 acetylase RimI n=1 Tax=Micromonospora narathiwatensis TaxID=299146 RepID=A0A1A8ZWC4_9ACTN|nr:GNAT family N-acetyltransferase [Micromonospora narathiwatensis]SBT48431.1 Ribosomal protein S18 acetylase RimI [Micromonospora narathiwatensis]
MVDARRASHEDAAELVRLRGLMLAAVRGTEPGPGRWQDVARENLREWLAEPEPWLAAFVVDASDGGLAACAVGTIERRLGSPHNPSGLVGYVFNVSTDPDHRRRGHSRSCLTALLDWFRDRDVRTVDLRASEAGLPLYRSLGFQVTHDPAMRLSLPPTTAD